MKSTLWQIILAALTVCLIITCLAACTVDTRTPNNSQDKNQGEDPDDPGAPEHTHTYGEWIAGVPATCTEAGVKGHYHCDGCGKNFDDKKQELTDLTIAATMHTYGTDNICMVCHTPLLYTEGLKYQLNEDNTTYAVTGIGTAVGDDIVLPCFYNDLPVTSIEEMAFANCVLLKSITIPASVTEIGDNAFENCTSLAGVYISDLAAWCGITFGTFINANFNANPLVYAHDLYIGGELATDITIPDGVTSIGNIAFSHCTLLESITIPASVTEIGSNAFDNCTSLAKVYISDLAAWCGITFGPFNANPLIYAHDLYISGELATDITIPDGVTSIGSAAFFHCTSLESITIPASVTEIGGNAFDACTNLKECILSVNITTISGFTFNDCENLSRVVFGKNSRVTKIESMAFQNCIALESIDFPAGLKYIGEKAFYHCVSLLRADIPDGVSSIDHQAFSSCDNLQFVTIPDCISFVGQQAFSYCPCLQYNVYGNAAYLGNTQNPFVLLVKVTDTYATSVTIPKSTKIIASFSFDYSHVAAIEIPASVTVIESYAFENCSELTSVIFEADSALTIIEDNAFENCRSLATIEIPANVTRIDNDVFRDCDYLKSITFANTEGWYHITSSGDEPITVTDAEKNVSILTSPFSFGFYREE